MSFVARLYLNIYYPLFNTKPVFLVLNRLCLTGSSSLLIPQQQPEQKGCPAIFLFSFLFFLSQVTQEMPHFLPSRLHCVFKSEMRGTLKTMGTKRVEMHPFAVCTTLGYTPCLVIR